MASDSETTPERLNQTLEEPLPSPSKRPKTLTQSPTSSNGKDTACDESESRCCGICLGESERIIRGWIESCDHYFCFVCIMEWSKVESRCPLCKRRFTTIRRPPIAGLFLTERVVDVPERNQVYDFFTGNGTIVHRDPYSLVKCTVCSSDADETYLLLCDLCDSASHTYCVGMGATIPEGDWFCQDCSITRAEHSKNETDAEIGSQDNLSNPNQTSFGVTDVSLRDTVRETNFRAAESSQTSFGVINVFSRDIVRETNFRAAESSQTEDSSNPNWLLSPSEVDRRVARSSSLMRQNPITQPIVAAAATTSDLGARTVRRCRNVQSRIRVLRENWNRFRSGSLSFSSTSVDSSGSNNRIPINRETLPDRSGQLLSTHPSSQRVPIQSESSLNATTPNKSSYDEAKAWKMLNAAKSLEKSRQKNNLVDKKSKTPVAEVCMAIGRDCLNSNLQVSRALKMAVSAHGLHQKDYHCPSLVKENRSHKSQELAIEKKSKFENFSKFGESSSIRAQGKHQSVFSVKVPTSIHVNVGQNRVWKPSEQNSYGPSFDVCTAQDGSTIVCSSACPARLDDYSVQTIGSQNNLEKQPEERFHAKSSTGCTGSNWSVCQIPQVGSGTEASNTYDARLEDPSASKLELPTGKAKKEQCHSGSKSSIDADDDAKCQIQFLVKLNLKTVRRDKKLGVDTFKEIARLSTHSILAACGLKQLKPGARSFAPTACHHINQVVKPRMSILMPRLCIECYHAFVKEVVDTIASEKIGSIQRSSR